MKILSNKIGNSNSEVVYNSEGNISLDQAIQGTGDYTTIAIDCSAHSNYIQEYDVGDIHSSIKLSTGVDGVFLSGLKNTINKFQIVLLTADCAPISFATNDGDVIGLLHGGWQGICGGILQNFSSIVEQQKRDKNTIYIEIGPMIGDLYEFQLADIEANFGNIFKTYPLSKEKYILSREGKTYFKLRVLILDLLKHLGFKEKNIVYQKYDTNEYTNLIPSHRLHTLVKKLLQNPQHISPQEKVFFESAEFEFYREKKRMMTFVRN